MRCGSWRSMENSKKTCFGQLILIRKVIDFWVIHYIRVDKKNFHNMDLMGVKRCRILRRFQKYKL
jgi:hypothetical protein